MIDLVVTQTLEDIITVIRDIVMGAIAIMETMIDDITKMIEIVEAVKILVAKREEVISYFIQNDALSEIDLIRHFLFYS